MGCDRGVRMRRFASTLGVLFAFLIVSACSLPRGAGFEAEVLAATRDEAGQLVQDFGVAPVTREFLSQYASWPSIGENRLGWINRQPDAPNRIIGPGDTVAITVWNTETNSLLTAPNQRSVNLGPITVSPSGFIFLPYIENIRISGMSPDRARAVLQERFTEIIPSAQVQLEMTEGRLSTVSLIGGVARPGSYPLVDQSYTIMALLAEAGGISQNLNNPQIRLVRGDAIYGTSVDRLLSSPGLDTTLRGGDKVFVEADDRYFLSLGAAGSQAIHKFPRDSVSALEAMAIIGGISASRADPQGILILREYPASALRQDGTGPAFTRTVFTIDLTSTDGLFSAGQFRIRSGDLVYATESPVTTAQTVLGLIGGSIGLTNQISRL